ncbi:hypothetical protein CLV98_10798 [Dyadobacter jejuensis]|uniref:Uncharacterized protein n=1 Tax=Dyadobacter jejuensis TaxID=1082580 RepID=A0A316AIB9_9BACT|nr:hypothetical protein CLV98_10798 [Dyadobacter jejuensis]
MSKLVKNHPKILETREALEISVEMKSVVRGND